jgi:hypothetical protein
MPFLVAVAAALFVTLAARAAPSFSAKAFCDGFEGAEVERLYGTCGAKDRSDPFVATRLERATRAKGQCRELLATSFSTGRVTTTQATAKQCLDARAAWAADRTRSRAAADRMRAACDAALVGLRKAGQSCDSAFECATGHACIGKRGGPPGTCRKPLPLGTSCDDDTLNASQLHALILDLRNVCGKGAHCGPQGSTLACRADLGEGKACQGQDRRECGVGLRCSDGTCTAETRGGGGEACKQAEDCDDGHYCSSKHRCEPKRAAGASCSAEHECKGLCRSGRCQAACGSG